MCQLSRSSAGATPRGVNSLRLWPATSHTCRQNRLGGFGQPSTKETWCQELGEVGAQAGPDGFCYRANQEKSFVFFQPWLLLLLLFLLSLPAQHSNGGTLLPCDDIFHLSWVHLVPCVYAKFF